MKDLRQTIDFVTKRLRFSQGSSPQNINSPIFDLPFYADITESRLKHLESLNLPFQGKTVIDLGCGIGRLSEFFFNQGSDVFCVDGRAENIQKLNELYPSYRSAVVDLQTTDILNYGQFDIVACYGLLYHLSDPFALLKNVYKLCKSIAIVETCITDADEPILRLVQEDQNDPTQALAGIGCRPSPAYIIECLRMSGFNYIYEPQLLPNHPEFRYQRKNDITYLRNGKLMRGIYIAAHDAIENSHFKRLR